MRTITIKIEDNFTITEDDHNSGPLGWDEMLGSIAELTHPKIGVMRYAMRTDEEWSAWREGVWVRSEAAQGGGS
ncbi:MAG: hypothetical protein KGJ21_09905 [Pseudomonadota bacterium]|nr:hypothetical protein [Pseudomonadota bacterium]